MNATQLINWVCGTQAGVALSPRGFVPGDPQMYALCLTGDGAPIRREHGELDRMRRECYDLGGDFALDRMGLIALNRVVVQPLLFAQVEDQLGRVLAVSYSPASRPDPVLPVSLVDLGPRCNAALGKLARHIEGYSDLLSNPRRWGKQARRLVDALDSALVDIGRASILTRRELAFIRYHAELSIAQPWRTR